MTGPILSPSRIYDGRRLFLIGGTGFLGKVTLSMLLHRFPEVGRVYLMVRPGSGRDSEGRFWNSVMPSPAFEPLRQKYGEDLEDFVRSKVTVVGGDTTKANLGHSEEEAKRIAADIDVVLNCSGKVDFNPPLEASLRTNVTGTTNTLAFARRMQRPAYVHISTCFVAGNRSGEIWEDESVEGYFPRRGQDGMPPFDVEQEIAECERLITRVKDEAEDTLLNARFREAAIRRFREEGRDPDDESQLRLAVARERKNWIRERLMTLGLERAKGWGWPNIYTYTKSIGEQLVAKADGVVKTILRPAVVESAIAYPFPGWNEGFNTSAPFIRDGLNGQPIYPMREGVVMDFIPIDYVASATLAATAAACVEQPKFVHQLSSGDLNPFTVDRAITLLGLAKRQKMQAKETGSKLWNELLARMEARVTNPEAHEKYVMPALERLVEEAVNRIETLHGKAPGALKQTTSQLRDTIARADRFVRNGKMTYETFKPFVVENNYRFRADNTRALFARIAPEEGNLLVWAPEKIDWYDWYLNVHIPGLQKWIFPRLEEEEAPARPRRVYTYGSLLELFDTVTKLHGGRVAMRVERDGKEERYTFSDFRECALRVAAFLAGHGVTAGDRVGLLSENCPEWGMTYFGILKAGATVIPLEKELSSDEVANLLNAGQAKGVVFSANYARRHGSVTEKLAARGTKASVWSFDDVFALGDAEEEKSRIASLPSEAKPADLASLIFTSGTTGTPKGVMLTHRNFCTLLNKMLQVFEFDETDGLLSVLPLHHSLEFSAGFLMPFSRGAQVTYLTKLSEDTIQKTLRQGHTTCIVGVPALWEVLKRGIEKKLSEKAETAKWLMELLIDANYHLREETGVNLGPVLFWPVHSAFGGRIRYLISGGAALAADVAKTFRGLGFELHEGYGLTEAAPVLSVTRPDTFPPEGSVGPPLPGVEIQIRNPDKRGVGEIAARGANVMAGYYQNEEATRAVLQDGWLLTGDLGRLDEKGNLFIAGRVKDVIIGANGKNVYPDELEELYGATDLLKELCVVGLSDGAGEKIACLAVPKGDAKGTREEIEQAVREHFRKVSSTLPSFKRVRLLKLGDDDLPRTATRKVKRRVVQDILARTLTKESGGNGRPGSNGHSNGRPAAAEEEPIEETKLLPREVAETGSKMLAAAQRWAYFHLLKSSFHGQANVPVHTNFLVAANHQSHLDMGLVKMALGDAGDHLVALAAADYFFDNRAKKFFFENFTNLVPMDRKGSIRKSFQTAFDLLRAGKNVLIFPEGTRSRTGQMQPFQRGLGFLVIHGRVGVLPVYVDTHKALPVGTVLPRKREISATVGPYLSQEFIEKLTASLSGSQAQLLVTLFVQGIVEALRDGREPDLDIDRARQRWQEEPRAARVPVTVAGDEEEA